MMFCYTCHNYVLVAYKELDYPSKRRMTKASMRHVLLCASIYLFVGIFGYLTFPDTIPAYNLLIEYNPAQRLPFMVALVTMTISSITSLPFIVKPCKESILVIFYPGNKEKRDSRVFGNIILVLVFILLVIVSYLCVVSSFNLVQILTLISTFTSPLVRFFNILCV